MRTERVVAIDSATISMPLATAALPDSALETISLK